MSLAHPTPAKIFSYGIIASSGFDDKNLLPELFEGHLNSIGHIYTNGANPFVLDFARNYGIPHTVFPLTAHRSLPWSTSRIVEASDAVYVIANEESKSAKIVLEQCERRAKKDAKFKYKLVGFDSVGFWKGKVFKAKEILACATPEDGARNLWMNSVGEALEK